MKHAGQTRGGILNPPVPFHASDTLTWCDKDDVTVWHWFFKLRGCNDVESSMALWFSMSDSNFELCKAFSENCKLWTDLITLSIIATAAQHRTAILITVSFFYFRADDLLKRCPLSGPDSYVRLLVKLKSTIWFKLTLKLQSRRLKSVRARAGRLDVELTE